MALTQLKLPCGSRLLFAGTESGSVRAYRFPLSGNYSNNQINEYIKNNNTM